MTRGILLPATDFGTRKLLLQAAIRWLRVKSGTETGTTGLAMLRTVFITFEEALAEVITNPKQKQRHQQSRGQIPGNEG